MLVRPAHRTHQCVNRFPGWCGFDCSAGVGGLGDVRVWSGDAEHGDDSFLGDADFGDEGFDSGFAFAVAAAGDDRAEVGAEALDDIGRGWCGFGAEPGDGAAGTRLSQACLARLACCLPQAVLDSDVHFCIFVLWI